MLGNSEQESIALSVFCPQWRWAPIGGRGRWSRDTASAALQEGQQVEEEEEKVEEKVEEEEEEKQEGRRRRRRERRRSHSSFYSVLRDTAAEKQVRHHRE